MPNAAQPAAALRDRAERHVFAALAELPAIERRVLALLELTDADRAATARDTGLDEQGVREAAARARKALRRSRAPLSAGGRCEHAELLLSDRIDGTIDWRDGRWLDIHLDRCPRCREHEALLEEARSELRATFVAEPEEPVAAPEPPRPDERARLRVVPEPWTDEEASPPEAPPPLPAVPEEPARALATRRAAALRAAKVVAAVLLVAAVIAAIVLGISRLGGGDAGQIAPWAHPDAPVVHPSPISGQ